MYYVVYPINGRNDFYNVAIALQECGITDAEYTSGGWDNHSVWIQKSCIRFLRKEDALIFVLAHGGEYAGQSPPINYIEYKIE